MNNKPICLIPARGGSKRIPKKNIKEFLGIPIIAYSIKAAKESNLFDKIYVFTDDQEIKKIANSYGAITTLQRSKDSANDFATLSDVVEDFINVYEKYEKIIPKYLCCLLATSPLVKINTLQTSLELLEKDEKIDSVRPITEFTYPTQRALILDKENKIDFLYPQFKFARSQDLEKTYHDAGQFYFMKWKSGLAGPNKKGIVISPIQTQDIDNETDWLLAEIKYKLLNQLL